MNIKKIDKTELLKGFDYANKTFSNKEYNYTVVPKCASSIIIDTLQMTEGKNINAKGHFTFIRHPYGRLKSYLYQERCYTYEETVQKIQQVLENFDNFNEHCVPYNYYITYNDFKFVGTLENFDNGFKDISNKKIIKESRREDNKDIETMHDELIEKNSKKINEIYADDFILYEKARKCITPRITNE